MGTVHHFAKVKKVSPMTSTHQARPSTENATVASLRRARLKELVAQGAKLVYVRFRPKT